MKTKRFLSLLLALVMSLSLAAPAFADGPDDGDGDNGGIMPRATLFQDPAVSSGSGSYRSETFTSTPGNGKYIKVWYANRSDHDATVYLYRTDRTDYVGSVTVKAGDYYEDNVIWYTGSNTAPVSYYVRIRGVNSYPVSGYLSILQTDVKD